MGSNRMVEVKVYIDFPTLQKLNAEAVKQDYKDGAEMLAMETYYRFHPEAAKEKTEAAQ